MAEIVKNELILEKIAFIQVVDQASKDQAEQAINIINNHIKQLKAEIDPLVDKAYQSHKALTRKRKDTLAPYEKAVADIKSSLVTYARAEQEKARIEQERLRKEQAEAQERARQELVEQQRQLELVKQFGTEQEQAELVECIDKTVDVLIEKPKVVDIPKSNTVVYVDTYEIVVKENAKVPTHFCGVEIRPIDTGIIKKFAKEWVKSGMELPGVEIVKTQTIRSK